MRDLYTSAVHLKRLLAGQATPAFTPAPETVLKVLDPAFFPGMGALNENPLGQLQCPVRGCGQWHAGLPQHLAMKHKTIGGAAGIRSALNIPPRQVLLGKTMRAHYRATIGAATARMHRNSSAAQLASRENTLARGRAMVVRNNRTSAHRQNWSDTCPAQLQAKLEILARQLGHSPSENEFSSAYGVKCEGAIRRHFGTWNAAKAACGLTLLSGGGWNRKSIGDVAECLRAFYDAHGDLPGHAAVSGRRRVPYVPAYLTVLHAFGVDNWPAAMRSAGEYLGVKSERYGFDFRKAR